MTTTLRPIMIHFNSHEFIPHYPSLHHTLHFPTGSLPPLEVTWRPPHPSMHYQHLYRGICCYLRAPPRPERLAEAQQYLTELIESRHLMIHPCNERVLQDDRIRWVREWIRAMPINCDECSDAETVEEENK